MLLAFALTGAQTNLIIAVTIVFAALFAGNSVLLVLFFHKRKKSKLFTEELQNRREALLEELHNLQLSAAAVGVTAEELEEEDEAVMDDDDEAEDEAEDDVTEDAAAAEEETATSFNAQILAVRDMPQAMREKHGFVGEQYDNKRYYVRATYSFGARLARANYDVRVRYEAVANALGGIFKSKAKRSFRQERVTLGRKTIALLLFRGKKLCVALALDPTVYAETKYRGIDVSDKKRFASTPMLLKLTSPRKVDYALYLIEQLALANAADFDTAFQTTYDFTVKSNDELFATGDVKFVIVGEAEDAVADEDDFEEETPTVRAGILAVNDMSGATRAALQLVGAAYDDKRYYVRYNYSFEAKLRSASEEVKQRYASLIAEAYCYKKLKVKETFRLVRLSVGRKTLGQIVFRGKTLCLALALNPADYSETKYRGVDVSDKKRFAATPMLLKLTSARRLSYAKYLLTRLAENNNLQPDFANIQMNVDVSAMDVNQLFNQGLLKITIIGEAPKLK